MLLNKATNKRLNFAKISEVDTNPSFMYFNEPIIA